MGLDGKNLRRYFKWALDDSKEARLRVLCDVPLFKGIGRKLLRRLLVDLIEKRYSAGDVIFREGDAAKAIYVVLEGSVRITKLSGDAEKTLAVLGPGLNFGELALISGSTRYATTIAEEETVLLIMYKSYFDDLIRGNSPLSSKILLNLAEILSYYILYNESTAETKKD